MCASYPVFSRRIFIKSVLCVLVTQFSVDVYFWSFGIVKIQSLIVKKEGYWTKQEK